jgi:hypothetical protein
MQLEQVPLLVFLHWSIGARVVSHFLLAWFVTLILAVIYGSYIGADRNGVFPTSFRWSGEDHAEGLARRYRAIDYVAGALFFAFVSLYVSAIYYREDFAYYDDDMLTDFSLRGIPFAGPIWLGVGRFFPLAGRGFNVLSHFTRSATGYHSAVVVELILFIVVVFAALKEFRVLHRVLILTAVMLAPSFVIPFSGFVYPERSVLWWFAILVLCLCGQAETRGPAYVVGCLVATQFALYYKEPVVVFIIAYAGSRLLLSVYLGWHGRRRPWREIIAEERLPIGMLGLAGVYTLLFVAAMFSSGGRFAYVTSRQQGLISTLVSYLQLDWLLAVFLVVVSVKVGGFLLSESGLDPIWDPLAIGAVAYYVCIICLRMYSAYYVAPADFIALLYVAHTALTWLHGGGKRRAYVVAILFVCIVLHRVAYSSFRIIERKAVIATKSQLADFVKGYRSTANSSTIELYFPYADGYRLMELSSYLRYKGIPLAGQNESRVDVGPAVVIKGRNQFQGDRCVGYRDYTCLHAEKAEPGALIVVLPDDDISMEAVRALGNRTIPVLSVRICSFCSGENRWFRHLSGVSAGYWDEIPKHWLQLDVFKEPV